MRHPCCTLARGIVDVRRVSHHILQPNICMKLVAIVLTVLSADGVVKKKPIPNNLSFLSLVIMKLPNFLVFVGFT